MIGHESGQLVYVREIWGHASDQWRAQWSGGSLEAVGQGDGGAGISPASLKMALAGVLGLLLMVGGTWEGQDWRYGKQLAKQAALHRGDLTATSNAAADQVRTEQDERQALESRLQVVDETHSRNLAMHKNISRLRDRLASADLRLSVLLDAADPTGGCSVSRYRRRGSWRNARPT